RGQFREAEAVLRDPEVKGHPGALIYLTELLCESWRGREAEDALSEAARLLGPNHADVVGWRARVLALTGRPREAVPLLEPLTQKRYPGNPWPHALGRIVLEDLDDPEGAIRWLKLAVSEPPQAGELAVLARAELLAGHAGEARQLLEPVSRG